MNRRLIVLRHAKSSWSSDAPTDHARPLNKRGRRDAPRMGSTLAERGWVPEAVFSSDSERTRQTWAGVLVGLRHDPAVTFTRDLYHAGLDELRDLAIDWDEEWGTVLALGHNPGWSDVASELCGQSLVLRTCDAALLEGTGDTWADALGHRWRLADLLIARQI